MSSPSSWHALGLDLETPPKLLLKSNCTSHGYDVQLTDVSRIWAERLSKKDIIRRAWDTNSSIDPSEDDEQFSIFIAKIESALDGKDGTSRRLLPDGDDKLSLELTAPLPKPLPSFTWTISLARQPEEALADALIVPLLHQASTLQDQVQQLIHELLEKDRVISKITDRLETSGNDLTTVFPGVSNVKTNRKKSQREQLSRHIRGLADFDEAAWRTRCNDSDATGIWERVERVLEHLPEPEGGSSGAPQRWWDHLLVDGRSSSEAQSSHRVAQPFLERTGENTLSRDESMIEDEFQRQGTPDHPKHKASPLPKKEPLAIDSRPASHSVQQRDEQHGDESTTEDEDDLAAPPSKNLAASLSNPNPGTSGSSKKLGTMGGRSSKPPSSPVMRQSPDEQQQLVKQSNKLGAIGGKTRTSEAPAPTSTEEDPPSSEPTTRKMGVIGGKRKPSTATPIEKSPSAPSSELMKVRSSRAPTKEPTPSPRETSQERADRKRDQLKRELEQKAKAPAKKKRKF